MSILLSRLDQLDQHELKINSLQIEVDQLKKTNFDLEKKNNKLVLASDAEKLSINDDVTSRDFLPRSCYEIKATNPGAQMIRMEKDFCLFLQLGKGSPSSQVYHYHPQSVIFFKIKRHKNVNFQRAANN